MEQRLGLDEWDSEVAFTIKYLLFKTAWLTNTWMQNQTEMSDGSLNIKYLKT